MYRGISGVVVDTDRRRSEDGSSRGWDKLGKGNQPFLEVARPSFSRRASKLLHRNRITVRDINPAAVVAVILQSPRVS